MTRINASSNCPSCGHPWSEHWKYDYKGELLPPHQQQCMAGYNPDSDFGGDPCGCKVKPELPRCIHCGKERMRHGGLARCDGGATQFEAPATWNER